MAGNADFHLLLCLEFPWKNRVAGVCKKKFLNISPLVFSRFGAWRVSHVRKKRIVKSSQDVTHSNTPLILLGDFNTRHIIWDAKGMSARGKVLER
jgi:hypothetical protein